MTPLEEPGDPAAGAPPGAAPAPSPAEPEAPDAGSAHVTVLELGARRVHVVGTAHVSRHSVAEVEAIIERLRPDTVCVELCPLRYAALASEGRTQALDLRALVRRGDAPFVLASLVLQGYQRRLGKKLGVVPGAELLAAAKKAREVGAELVLADRDVRATLRRVWHNLPFRSRVMVGLGLVATLVDTQEVSEADVEQLKKREHVKDVMAELARLVPGLKAPLIDERDRYLMSAIEDAPGARVVAVVGAGHVAGMIQAQGQRADRAALSAIPSRRLAAELRRWLLPALCAGAVALALARGVPVVSLLVPWLVATAAAAFVVTAYARPKPGSLLAATLLAPLAALLPPIDPTVVVGSVEARLRPFGEADRQRLADDTTSFRGLRGNPVSRVLLVAVLARLGARLGAFVGAILLWIRAL
ncbi:MAG: TraB family protein [Myxococcales bacterium]|nr:TraB family protein [Myxococcales bacterium]